MLLGIYWCFEWALSRKDSQKCNNLNRRETWSIYMIDIQLCKYYIDYYRYCLLYILSHMKVHIDSLLRDSNSHLHNSYIDSLCFHNMLNMLCYMWHIHTLMRQMEFYLLNIHLMHSILLNMMSDMHLLLNRRYNHLDTLSIHLEMIYHILHSSHQNIQHMFHRFHDIL